MTVAGEDNYGSDYKAAGVNIAAADSAKIEMARLLMPRDPRIINGVGPFATLIDASFPSYQQPLIVFKTEEPGTKQKLAIAHGSYRSICFDLINHLINDIVVMGAEPVAVQDAIICGKLRPNVIVDMVKALADACSSQQCSLTGGETSEQPGVIDSDTYILTASVVGVVERAEVIDGRRIEIGDSIMALASSGVHTNGFSLIRRLLGKNPELANELVGQKTIIEQLLEPHCCYLQALRPCMGNPSLRGLAHITGGGIKDNLRRILPVGMLAEIDLRLIDVPDIFKILRRAGSLTSMEMLRVFNMGVGMVAVMAPGKETLLKSAAESTDISCFQIGKIVASRNENQDSVSFCGDINW